MNGRRVFIDPAPVSLDDPEPSGYMEWHEWAGLQAKAKRKQIRCEFCCRYWWPHTGRCRICDEIRTKKQAAINKASEKPGDAKE